MRLDVIGEITERAAQRFIALMRTAPPTAEVEVFIDSPGGDVGYAIQMAQAITDHRGPTTTIIAKADSAALLVGVVGKKRIATRDASALVHEIMISPIDIELRNAAELRSAADWMEHEGQRGISEFLAAHTNETSSYWTFLARKNTHLDARSLVNYGCADEESPLPKAYLRK